MTKAIIFDADGMVVVSDMFTVRYCEEYKVPYEDILPFFKNEFQLCLIGKADLKEQIKPYLERWGWKKSVEDFLEFWFKVEHSIDQRVVKAIKKLKGSGIKCYLATNQEKYRTAYLRNHMGFDKIFDRIFSSAEIGYKKPQPEFYDKVVVETGFKKDEIQFWDDIEENVQGAKDFGLDARHYRGFEEFKIEIASLTK